MNKVEGKKKRKSPSCENCEKENPTVSARLQWGMSKAKGSEKSPSRKRYEEAHPTRSCRLNKEDDELLDEHLERTGRSFADFVKDHLRKEETMVEERVAQLALKKVRENETSTRDLELYDLVLDLANWIVVLWMCLPDLLHVPCPDCRFPPQFTGKHGRTVMLEMVKGGDFKCPECGFTIKNPPQLAWVLLVNKAAEEVRREKLMFPQPKEKQGKDGGTRAQNAA